jgi:hypothetical protein
MPFRRGAKRSPPEKVAHRVGAHLHADIAAALAAGPKGSADLPTVESTGDQPNQGESETCHSHSLAFVIWCAFAAAGKPLGFKPSPLLLASLTYAAEQRPNAPAGLPLPTLQDTGSDLQDDASAAARWGIAPIKAPTSDGRFSDVPNDFELPDGAFPEPDVMQLQIAGADLIAGEYQIPVDANAPNLVAASLDARIPVWLGTLVGAAFQALGANDIAQPTPPSDTSAGGHAMYLSGYRTNAAGKLEFKVRNSWGGGWAMGGAVWASEEWLKACWSLWPMAVAS